MVNNNIIDTFLGSVHYTNCPSRIAVINVDFSGGCRKSLMLKCLLLKISENSI